MRQGVLAFLFYHFEFGSDTIAFCFKYVAIDSPEVLVDMFFKY